jgi:hypothetical protein
MILWHIAIPTTEKSGTCLFLQRVLRWTQRTHLLGKTQGSMAAGNLFRGMCRAPCWSQVSHWYTASLSSGRLAECKCVAVDLTEEVCGDILRVTQWIKVSISRVRTLARFSVVSRQLEQ